MALVNLSIFLGILIHMANGVPVELPTALAFDDAVDNRVVGGVEAPDNHSPHMMALVVGTAVTTMMCGASIVSDHHVLTAAHCIDALVDLNGNILDSVYGAHGSNYWRSTDKTVKFKRYINHEKWDAREIKYDLGVLFVEKKSDKWPIIKLNFERIEGGHKCQVAGWGSLCLWCNGPERLHMLDVDTMTEQACRDGVTAASGGWPTPLNHDIEMCALNINGFGFGVCHGDSGSALVSLKTRTQVGIVSWGFPCGRGAPDVYVRVSGFKEFILDTLKQRA